MPVIPVTPGWFVVRTQSNRERYAADNIRQSGATCYLPQVLETVRKVVRGKRIREFRRSPLFPGYVFAKTGGQWRFLLTTFGVVGLVLSAGGHPGILSNAAITGLQAREGDAGTVLLPESKFRTGQTIRVGSGMFTDHYGQYVGLVRENSATERVKILLDYMGRKVNFLLEEDALVEAA